MLKILINSYTCCPNMGSEQGMGWNWIISLVKTGEVELFVVSEGEYCATIEEWIACEKLKVKSEKYADGEDKSWVEYIHFYWNPVPQSTRDKCWNQGNWSFYPLYDKWQKKTAEIARDICKEHKIDILHQLNMIGFREPGYLWQVSKETGIPFVWGPVDAKDKFPLAYANGASLKTKVFLWLKNTISVYQLKHSHRVKAAAKQASVLLGASSNSVLSFKKYIGIDAKLMNETGCSCDSKFSLGAEPHESKSLDSKCQKNGVFNVLWVGKMDFRKQLAIAIKSIALVKNRNINLHIVGAGDSSSYKILADNLGISDRVLWHGAISHGEVQCLMRNSDILLFTSVAEGTPHVVLEAIANGLPVICHDTCGHGDSVSTDVGRKIPMSNPSQSAKDFAAAIDYFNIKREELTRCSANCFKRAEELSWSNKAKKMVELYKSVLDGNE